MRGWTINSGSTDPCLVEWGCLTANGGVITGGFRSQKLVGQHDDIGSSSIYRGELSFLSLVQFCIFWRDSAILTGNLF